MNYTAQCIRVSIPVTIIQRNPIITIIGPPKAEVSLLTVVDDCAIRFQ